MTQLGIYLVVIAGGNGTRFWPKSTSRHPKQLLKFSQTSSHISTLAETLHRYDGLVPRNHRLVVTTKSLAPAVKEHAQDVKILIEPMERNIAPAVYWAAQEVASQDPDGVMIVVPADIYISDLDRLIATTRKAVHWAKSHDDLVTLGVLPSRPETAFSYLKVSQGEKPENCRPVEAFIEKPCIKKARRYLKDGNYLWNSGMLIWKAHVILEAFDRFLPEMKAVWQNSQSNVELAYPQLSAISIDHGIMEKAKNVVSFPLDCGWEDLGSWTAVESLADTLHAWQGENVITDGDLIALDSKNNIIDAQHHTVTLLGVNHLIIVTHGDAILIASKERAQDVRQVVEQVRKLRPDLT